MRSTPPARTELVNGELVAEDRAAHGRRDRVQQVSRAALPSRPCASEDPRALDHRSSPRQTREGQDPGAHEGGAGDALPSADGSPTHGGVRPAASSRPHREGQANQDRPSRRASTRHREDIAPRRVRPSTTVNGYLGTAGGIAIAGHTVRVLTAPDNGGNQFTQAAVVTTAANGTWTAKLPPGPSRVVEAVYGGDPTTESASSGQVHVVVPAKVKLLSVSPSRVAWGGTVRITGQLLGGYLPTGGALVRLRIGQGSSYQTYGVQEHVTGKGRFTTTLHVRRGVRGDLQELLVPDRDFADGRLPLCAGCVRPSVSSGRRAPLPPPPPAAAAAASSSSSSAQAQEANEPPMIARDRGDERIHSRWRPGGSAATQAPGFRTCSASMTARSMSSTRRKAAGDEDQRTASPRAGHGHWLRHSLQSWSR